MALVSITRPAYGFGPTSDSLTYEEVNKLKYILSGLQENGYTNLSEQSLHCLCDKIKKRSSNNFIGAIELKEKNNYFIPFLSGVAIAFIIQGVFGKSDENRQKKPIIDSQFYLTGVLSGLTTMAAAKMF